MSVSVPTMPQVDGLPQAPKRSVISKGKSVEWLDIFLGYGPSLAALIVVGALIVVLGIIAWNGAPHINWTFLTSNPNSAHDATYGILPTIIGTLFLSILMIVLALPLGVSTAVYLTEYAGNSRFARITRAAVNNLAGVPSIVFGLFGVGFFILFIGKGLDRLTQPIDPTNGQAELFFGQPALFWAACTLACLVLPVVIVATEEALLAVPRSYREAALAVGATKWQAIWDHVIPQARGGILTGAILAISRGAGETAPILFTGAAYFLPDLPIFYWNGIPVMNPWTQFMEMAYHIYILATQSHNPETTLPHQYATTLVLLLLTFGLNLVAIIARYQYRKSLAH